MSSSRDSRFLNSRNKYWRLLLLSSSSPQFLLDVAPTATHDCNEVAAVDIDDRDEERLLVFLAVCAEDGDGECAAAAAQLLYNETTAAEDDEASDDSSKFSSTQSKSASAGIVVVSSAMIAWAK